MGSGYLESSLDRIPEASREDVIEICVNPDGRVWGEFQGDHFMQPLETALSETQAKDLANQVASATQTTMSKSKPVVSVSIEYRNRPIRAQVMVSPVVGRGASISLRFFTNVPLDKIELKFLYGEERSLEQVRQERTRELRSIVASGDITACLRFCVDHKLNMIVAGGTSTGKTVAARKILSYVPPEERIVTIEEAAELLPAQPNAVTLISNREVEHQTADALLTSTLRMRPDRIVLGEVRGQEAMTFLEAIISHPQFRDNSYTTKFIDQTPELFQQVKRRDRATNRDWPRSTPRRQCGATANRSGACSRDRRGWRATARWRRP